ncbi:MAG: prepilin-type N-terminal cleavage/methylation domain-containing protein, partial [Candidatus Binatia bacterium]
MTRRGGFTLIEVLVAMLVASVSAAALAASAHALVAGRVSSEGEIAMTLLAQRSLEEMLARPPAMLVESDVGDQVIDAGGTFARRRVVRARPEPSLWEIEVTVTGSAAPVAFRTVR